MGITKYLAIFFNPIILLISFWVLFYNEKSVYPWAVGLAVLIILLTGRVIARSRFFKTKVLWINFIFVYISQVLFLLLLTSESLRYFLSFVLAGIWLLIWWLMSKYFENIDKIESSNYLMANKFLYYLSFWFLATSLYSLVIFLHFPLLYSISILIVVTFFWSLDIVKNRNDISWLYLLFSLFLLVQIISVTYLLPVNFYVAGTIATLWFFFIIDNTSNNLKSFRLYLGLFLLAILLLLTTAII